MVQFFISHAAFDSDLAMYLKTLLEDNFSKIGVFCSSDPMNLAPGSRWPQRIQDALRNTDILFLLATSRSLSRPWVWFECGTLWFTNKNIVPLCTGDVRKTTLPTLLSERMALNLDDTADFAVRSNFDIHFQSLAKSFKKLESEIQDRFLQENSGWIGVPWNGRFLCYDGPIEGLRLIEDRDLDSSMSDALRSGGFTVSLVMRDKLSEEAYRNHRIIHVTDRKSWRQRVRMRELILIAKP